MSDHAKTEKQQLASDRDDFICCPYCGIEYELEGGSSCVTYHGDGDTVVLECGACLKLFFVHEHVSRTWSTSKQGKLE